MNADELVTLASLEQRPLTILGINGFIGSHLARFCERHSIAYWGPSGKNPQVFNRPLGHVIYAIGLTADFADRPFDTVEAHVGYLASVLRDADFRSLVYLSSTRLYDSVRGRATETVPLALDPHNPRHLFDLSKALGEALCIGTTKHARVARLSSVYAEDLSGPNFLNTIIRNAVDPAVSTIATPPNLSRDYIDMADVSPLLLAIALKGKRRIYNIASGENLSNDAILQKISSLTGRSFRPTAPSIKDSSPQISVDAILEDFSYRPASLLTRLPNLVKRASSEVS